MIKRGVGLSLALLIAGYASSGAPDRANTETTVRPIITEFMTASNTVGTSVAVVRPDGIQTFHFGFTDRENGGRPTDETLYEIGSFTKIFTTSVLLQLLSRGELQLDNSVTEYLPDLDEAWRDVSLEQLATHTSGMGDAAQALMGEMFSSEQPITRARFIDAIDKIGRESEAGERWRYNNGAMALLGHALTSKAGLPVADDSAYEELLRLMILDPLGMNRTSTMLSRLPEENFAQGYFGSAPRNFIMSEHLGPVSPAGGLISNLEDMSRFAMAHLVPESNLLERQWLDLAFASRFEAHQRANNLDQMGIGWWKYAERGRDIVWHGGSTSSFETFVGFDLEHEVGVVILSNTFIAQQRDFEERIGIRFAGFDLLHSLSPDVQER